jgi:2-amino-4-hydroxy-6-hydroxymethyldihydropteridine diphosphokinase
MSNHEHSACLLVGSNIQPEKNLALGVELLEQIVAIKKLSSVWETPSIGCDGPDFLNIAMLITTPLEADELKDKVIRPLEARLGRVRSANKNAPRPMDIDIIIFDNQLVDPDLFYYAHRAVPVAEILPDYQSGWSEPLRKVACKMADTPAIRARPDILIKHKLNIH